MSKKEKFAGLDRPFIDRREAYFAEAAKGTVDPKFLVDNWSLFVGTVPLGIYLARYELLKLTVGVPGHLLELGVFNGSHLLFIAKVMRLLAPHDLKRIFGFDSFAGLTEFSAADGDAAKIERDRYKGRAEGIHDMLRLHDLEGSVELVDGVIEETLPRFVAEHPHHFYSYVYLDTDLYTSTALALKLLWPALSPGGVVALDEGYHDRFPGEGTAAQEFLRTLPPGSYELGSIPFARQPMLYVRKK